MGRGRGRIGLGEVRGGVIFIARSLYKGLYKAFSSAKYLKYVDLLHLLNFWVVMVSWC